MSYTVTFTLVSPREVAFLEAFLKCGASRSVARITGVGRNTVSARTKKLHRQLHRQILKNNGTTMVVPSRLKAP